MDCIGIWVIRGCLGMEYGFSRDIIPIKENQMEKRMEDEMETGMEPAG